MELPADVGSAAGVSVARRLALLVAVLALAAACASSDSLAMGERYPGVIVGRWPALPETGGRWLVAVHAGKSLYTIEVSGDDWLWLEPKLRVVLTRLRNGRWVIEAAPPSRRDESEGADA